ncbi:hypothetical protein LCGC14_0918260 [marine sediment metagenome]|uniref:Uncharacterized protein n=1 Tax=marine sediment metagenome TaxID=412755 RepID=A0A0F9NWC4_9ZZZZ|nr:hypothetical protein [bacterium]
MKKDEEDMLKKRLWKLKSKVDNQKNEIHALKRNLSHSEGGVRLLIEAFNDLGVHPKMICSCYKDDCGCFDSSVNPGIVYKKLKKKLNK